MPKLKGELYDYQKETVEFLEKNNGRAIINSAMGVGKTFSTLAYLVKNEIPKTLVICPASVKYVWENEVEKFTNLKSLVVDSKTKTITNCHVVIINFDILHKFFKILTTFNFSCLVIDECVIPQTYILTNKGQEQIVNLKEGDLILTYNLETKQNEYKPIKRIIKKPLLKKLVKIKDLVCTEDHKIWIKEEFIEAKYYNEQQNIKHPIRPPTKSGTSEEILIGTLFGDGHLTKQIKNSNVRIKLGHTEKQKEYLIWKTNHIDCLKNRPIVSLINKGYFPNNKYYRVCSLTSSYLTPLRKQLYKNNKKIINIDLLNKINIAGLAIWLQDDGSCTRKMIRINTQRYNFDEHLLLKKWFIDKYKVNPRISIDKKKDRNKEYYYLSLNVEDSYKIYCLIRDYIVPSMYYKFKTLEEKFNKIYSTKCIVCGRRILNIHKKRPLIRDRIKICDECKKEGSYQKYWYQKKTKNKTKNYTKQYQFVYDLEIEDNHNYFADNILVHNCQMTKNPKAKRSKLVKLISTKIPKCILLSGTLMLNRPIEIFYPLHILDQKTWNNWWAFSKHFCSGHRGYWGWDTSGASNIDELRQKISKYYIRHTKEQVLKDLPPKRIIDIPIDLDKHSRDEYDLAMKSFVDYLKEVKNKTDKQIKKSLQAEKLVRLGELRKIAGMGKLSVAEEMITNVIEGGEKIVVFSCYREPLERLYEKFKDQAVILTGDTPSLERKEIVEKFQQNEKVKILFGGIRSAGIGLTLTASSTALFIDQDFVPANMAQSADRLHRISQKNAVTIYHLIARDTIDSKIKNILSKKQELFDKLFEESESVGGVNLIDELVENINKDN